MESPKLNPKPRVDNNQRLVTDSLFVARPSNSKAKELTSRSVKKGRIASLDFEQHRGTIMPEKGPTNQKDLLVIGFSFGSVKNYLNESIEVTVDMPVDYLIPANAKKDAPNAQEVLITEYSKMSDQVFHVEIPHGWVRGKVSDLYPYDPQNFYLKCVDGVPEGQTSDIVCLPRNILPMFRLPINIGDQVDVFLEKYAMTTPLAKHVTNIVYLAHRTTVEVVSYYSNLLTDLMRNPQPVLSEVLPLLPQWYFIANFMKIREKDHFMYLLLTFISTIIRTAMKMPYNLRDIISTVIGGGVVQRFIKRNSISDDNQAMELVKFCDLVMMKYPDFIQQLLPLIRIAKGYTCADQANGKTIQVFLYKQLVKHLPRNVKNSLASKVFSDDEDRPSFLQEDIEVETFQSVVIGKAYTDIESYLDTYIGLLKAECYSSLRNALKGENSEINRYSDVINVGYRLTYSKLELALQLRNDDSTCDWAKWPHLLPGNLVCLCAAGNAEPLWAVVSTRDSDLLTSSSIIFVDLLSELNSVSFDEAVKILHLYGGNLEMLESPVYFTPLAAALTSIQSFDMKSFQLLDDIVYLIPSAPCYQLKNDANPDIHNSKKMEQILSQLRPIEIEAFYYSIETSLAVVQAPPGTRDKLLASSVIQALGFYELEAPILLISNTSAALDEMLNILLAPGLFRKDDIGLLSGTDVYDLKSTLLSSQIQGELDILSKTLDNKLKSFSSALSESFSKLKTLNFFSDDIFPLILSQINDDQYKTLLTNAGYYVIGLLQSTRWITDNIANLSKIGSSARMKIVKFIQNKGESQDIKNSSDKNLTELVEVTVQVLKSWLPTRAEFYSMKQSSARVKLAGDVIYSHLKTEDVGLYSSNFVEYMSKQRFSCQTYGDFNFLISSNVLEESLLSENKYLSFLSDKADDPKTLDHGSLWTVNPKKKFQMLFTILENGQIDAVQNFQKILHQIETLQSERVLLELKLRVQTLRKKKIIASTVDCANVHAELLIKAVSPKVMVILEAGKILEPSILALLQTGVEHLIMFGDHRREMPAVQTASLSSDHKFNITMMERLISGD